MSTTVNVSRGGIGLGSALAIALSWSLHKSVGYAIVHAILGWIYVLVWVLS